MKQRYEINGVEIAMLLGGTGEPSEIVWFTTPSRDAAIGALEEVVKDADSEKVLLHSNVTWGANTHLNDILKEILSQVDFVVDPKDPQGNKMTRVGKYKPEKPAKPAKPKAAKTTKTTKAKK